MLPSEKNAAILSIRPGAVFIMRNLEVEWLDENSSEPTESEIEEAYKNYRKKMEADKLAEQAKRKAILDRLGITQEEANLLING